MGSAVSLRLLSANCRRRIWALASRRAALYACICVMMLLEFGFGLGGLIDLGFDFRFRAYRTASRKDALCRRSSSPTARRTQASRSATSGAGTGPW